MQLMSRAVINLTTAKWKGVLQLSSPRFEILGISFDTKLYVFIGTIHSIASHDALSIKVHLKGVDRDSKSLDTCTPDRDHESCQVNITRDLMLLARLLDVFPEDEEGKRL
jgi:hypothetical protein